MINDHTISIYALQGNGDILIKLEDQLIITVSTFSPDLASIDKFRMAYHVKLNTIFVKSSLTKTWTNNFRSPIEK